MRVVGYGRVSDPSQVEGHSLDAQERAFYEKCEREGWTPVRFYREEGGVAYAGEISRRVAAKELGIGYATLQRLIDAQNSNGSSDG